MLLLTVLSRFRRLIIQGYGYSRTLIRALALLWKVSPWETTFLFLTLVLQGMIPAVGVWITQKVVDTVSTSLTEGETLDISVLILFVIAWSASLLLSAILSPWEETVQGNLNEKAIAHFNLQLMEKSESFPDLTRFEDSQFHDELQFLRQEAARKPIEVLAVLSYGGRSLFTLISMLWLLAWVSWWLPLLILLAAFPQAYTSLQLSHKIVEMTFGNSLQSRRMDYCSTLMLTDTYAKEVRLFQLSPFLKNLYQQSFQELHDSMRGVRKKQALWSSGLSLLSVTGNAIAFFWVIQQSFQGTVGVGSVLVLVQSLSYIQQNLPAVIETFTSINKILLYMERFFNFLESPPTMVLASPGKPIPKPIRSGIVFDQVYFYYPDGRVALSDISFQINSGETVALVGENGAGKTTLVKLLTRLYDPSSGRICIDGENLKALDLEAWRKQIAVVFQDFGCYAFTVGENVALGSYQNLEENQERLKYAIEQVGLTELVQQLPEKHHSLLGKQFGGTELSGGQWQKLALSRAFFRQKEAQILILDEPTAALDPRSEYDIYHQFASLSQNKTTLLITHRLASVRMADRILALKGGKLVEEGTHEQLLQREGEYAALWRMQANQYSNQGSVG
jgi:ATP-binding cassette subfamily B protein